MLYQLLRQIDFEEMLFILEMIAVAAAVVIFCLRRIVRVTEPSCGACGYPVRGLKVNRCPECGGDFKQVGVTRPGKPRPIGAIDWCAIWTVFLWIGSSIVTPIAEPFWPTVRDSQIFGDMGSPWSKKYSGIQFEFDERWWSTGAASRTLRLEILHSNGTLSGLTNLEGDESSFTVVQNGSNPGALPGTTPQDVLDWMKRHGITAANGTAWPGAVSDPMKLSQDEAVLAEAQAISETIKRYMTGKTPVELSRSFRSGGNNSITSHGPVYQLEVHILGWIVWIGGCLVIIVKRWRKHRAAMNLT